MLSTNPKLRLRRGSIEEIKKISDPYEFALAAADYIGVSPFTLPPGFAPAADLLLGKKLEQWSKLKALPIAKAAGRLTVVFSDPFNLPSREEVARWAGGKIWTLVISEPELTDVLTRLKTAEDAANPALAMENIMKGDETDVDFSSVSDKNDELDASTDVAGEQSGEFAGILKRLSVILGSAARLKRKVKGAMTYPTVIVSIALLMSAGLIQFVVPIFAEMFSGFGKDLPALTQSLVALSNFVKRDWYILLGGIALAVFLFRKWKSTERGRYQFDEMLLKMPVFGPLNLKSSIGRFCRLLAQMTNAGVPILKSLEVVAGSMGNHVMEKSILDARKEVEQGNQLNVALDGKPYMPVLMVRMIAAGEKSGRVEDMLDSVADSYEEEVEALLSTLTSLMEPFLMVFLGAIIGTIVMAMFLPIFNMGSLAS